jgi:diguanylate cyclase (GGDEF)-like protein/PAS domain S-box-containing protein
LKSKQDKTPIASKLRKRAEQHLLARPFELNAVDLDQARLMHEFQVLQVELEKQVEELRNARNTAEQALAAAQLAHEGYVELFDFAPMAYFSLGSDSVIRRTNFQGEKLLGTNRFKLIGQVLTRFISPDFLPAFHEYLENVFASDISQCCQLRLSTGENSWVNIQATADLNRQACLVAIFDVSEQKIQELALNVSSAVYKSLQEAIMVTDAKNHIIAINPAFTKLTGYSEEEAIGQTSALLKSGLQDKDFYAAMWHELNSSGYWEGELWNRRKNGQDYLERLSISTICSENAELSFRVGTFVDLTEQKRAEAIIYQQAHFDSLTGLPNRQQFLDRLQALRLVCLGNEQKFALLCLDLDNFKDVNDTLGHDMGDNLLVEVAKRLKSCIAAGDFVARTSGDEFAILIGDVDQLSQIRQTAEAVLNGMVQPFQLKQENCQFSFSIGISIYPDDAVDAEDLLKKADQALYTAKQQGRNRYCFFALAMQEAAESRLRLLIDLRKALVKQEFWLAYQPIVDLATGHIDKAEALIRWQHPKLGLIGPADFIPIAEESGMIIEIGQWLFEQAVNQVCYWRQQYRAEFQISVNKSPVQFRSINKDHDGWFKHLKSLDMPGESIVVEITEGLLLDPSASISSKLLAFREAGMQISLDDFGTGYSSMAYLKKFDIDYLKIDQVFVRNLTDNSTDKVLCEAMILMAHKLGMKVIAEGIETKEQRDLLLDIGCDYGQGYLFSKPVSAEQFEHLLQP